MINVISECGQRSNRLYATAHCLASAIEYNQEITFWTMGSFADEYLCQVEQCKVYIRKPNIKIKLLLLMQKLLSKIGIKQSTKKLLRRIQCGNNVYISNWGFRVENEFVKYRKEIQHFFTPINKITERIDERFDNIYRKYDDLIAIHIRRGDYKQWENGRYFYEFNDYVKWAEEALKLIKGNCAFLIFSNEEVPKSIFESLPNVFFERGTVIEDQYLMSKCHYIISTVSTYAFWAEYMGNAYHATMRSKDEHLSYGCFKRIYE